MKKLLIALIVLAAIGVGFIPVATTMMINDAFAHPNDPGSPGKVDTSIRLKMRLYQFADARKSAEKAIIWFPESSSIDSFLYCAALCAEREGNDEAAIHWYSRFIEIFPSHPWTSQVKSRLEKLKNSGK
jgi:hypothetical protein